MEHRNSKMVHANKAVMHRDISEMLRFTRCSSNLRYTCTWINLKRYTNIAKTERYKCTISQTTCTKWKVSSSVNILLSRKEMLFYKAQQDIRHLEILSALHASVVKTKGETNQVQRKIINSRIQNSWVLSISLWLHLYLANSNS